MNDRGSLSRFSTSCSIMINASTQKQLTNITLHDKTPPLPVAHSSTDSFFFFLILLLLLLLLLLLRRWDRKRRVYDKDMNRTYDLTSGSYEQKELFGALRSFGGEKSRTFSHGPLILASNKSVEREIREGISGLNICDEWERKIMKTQGRPPKMLSFTEAFTLHPSSNAYNGTKFQWEYDAIEKMNRGRKLIKDGLGGRGGGGGGGHLYRKSTGENVVPKLDFDSLST